VVACASIWQPDSYRPGTSLVAWRGSGVRTSKKGGSPGCSAEGRGSPVGWPSGPVGWPSGPVVAPDWSGGAVVPAWSGGAVTVVSHVAPVARPAVPVPCNAAAPVSSKPATNENRVKLNPTDNAYRGCRFNDLACRIGDSTHR